MIIVFVKISIGKMINGSIKELEFEDIHSALILCYIDYKKKDKIELTSLRHGILRYWSSFFNVL
jgi:hypothetical protein